jgi:hypothetical protein
MVVKHRVICMFCFVGGSDCTRIGIGLGICSTCKPKGTAFRLCFLFAALPHLASYIPHAKHPTHFGRAPSQMCGVYCLLFIFHFQNSFFAASAGASAFTMVVDLRLLSRRG